MLDMSKSQGRASKTIWKIQPLEIPVWKWENITMDFVTKLPRTKKKHDAIWVIVDRLTKSAHFIPIREGMPVHKLAKIYVNEIVAHHEVPVSIVSDRYGRFTSNFWQDSQEEFAIRVKLVRLIGLEECAMWDWGKGTWGGRGVAFGAVLVCVRVQERAGEEGLILAGMVVKEDAATCLGGKGTWGGRAKVFGTVLVCVRVQERAGVRGEFWRE
nr:putative reverse transcriptase domain-containing protein [Tanacetum cinerariifolium]